MKHTDIMNEIDHLLQTYCDGCLVKAQLRRERGKTNAHHFCIKDCTVGDEIKEFGQRLIESK